MNIQNLTTNLNYEQSLTKQGKMFRLAHRFTLGSNEQKYFLFKTPLNKNVELFDRIIQVYGNSDVEYHVYVLPTITNDGIDLSNNDIINNNTIINTPAEAKFFEDPTFSDIGIERDFDIIDAGLGNQKGAFDDRAEMRVYNKGLLPIVVGFLNQGNSQQVYYSLRYAEI